MCMCVSACACVCVCVPENRPDGDDDDESGPVDGTTAPAEKAVTFPSAFASTAERDGQRRQTDRQTVRERESESGRERERDNH